MLLGAAGLGASVSPLATLAQAFLPTPRQAEGPFYPLRLPGDQDNDLVSVKGAQGTAKGEIAHLSGRILDANGRPLRGVRVEIWLRGAITPLATVLEPMRTPICRDLAIP